MYCCWMQDISRPQKPESEHWGSRYCVIHSPYKPVRFAITFVGNVTLDTPLKTIILH